MFEDLHQNSLSSRRKLASPVSNFDKENIGAHSTVQQQLITEEFSSTLKEQSFLASHHTIRNLTQTPKLCDQQLLMFSFQDSATTPSSSKSNINKQI